MLFRFFEAVAAQVVPYSFNSSVSVCVTVDQFVLVSSLSPFPKHLPLLSEHHSCAWGFADQSNLLSLSSAAAMALAIAQGQRGHPPSIHFDPKGQEDAFEFINEDPVHQSCCLAFWYLKRVTLSQ
eukprot:607419-Amphidinium_carterae.1